VLPGWQRRASLGSAGVQRELLWLRARESLGHEPSKTTDSGVSL